MMEPLEVEFIKFVAVFVLCFIYSITKLFIEAPKNKPRALSQKDIELAQYCDALAEEIHKKSVQIIDLKKRSIDMPASTGCKSDPLSSGQAEDLDQNGYLAMRRRRIFRNKLADFDAYQKEVRQLVFTMRQKGAVIEGYNSRTQNIEGMSLFVSSLSLSLKVGDYQKRVFNFNDFKDGW